ncbi:MAG TPA: hypothetical protein VEA41_14240 [Salinarimonas sp.]|nr:hypothetical protein [Salinarimonas sp.]
MPILTPTGGGDFVKVHIPSGTYPATLVNIRQFEMDDPKKPGQKKPMLCWEFEVTSKRTGDVYTIEGVTSMAWGPGAPGGQVPKNWTWVGAIVGTEGLLSPDGRPIDFDTDGLIGANVSIKVTDKAGKNGDPYSVVSDIVPPAGEF